ncbi:hypothetical protein BSK49_15295 [Paenibacillus odorifer]|jgi:hypothetical protein|uniref:DUF4317 domain-containing protein n=1 Tax=Paenibacillus odorifer TaxID=189426 RepID=A0ABX3GNT3_9BACL|nr:DUF4317 domain-containing protein [Paenibacillus odorifer]OMD28145.1 hypothetical protein BSO21_19635 [Paenibacillus odorifer]OMD57590.1 hypothetical protein BSK55_16830 [Paenibacillus odorifer]OMD64480.1 hypothetical protein BSK48_24665 [Paenibacillus odorifer]OMD87985.1 hypothetical protein BSK53_03085 [Paenibacillus odorifer]OMD88355.1 hypothetical protein BSK49_15295 [Paenibacillus odorifer]
MIKKEVAHIRKQFKLDHDLMSIYDILNVYIMKESNEIYHWERQPFGMVDREKQELYMGNFKKLLTGELDQKLFELKFQAEAEEPAQVMLHQALVTGDPDEWQDLMLLLVDRMMADTHYERDTVITFVRGQYFRPTKDRNDEAEESEKNELFAHPFILCSVNSTEKQRKALLFDYVEREFKYNVIVDPIVKLSTPEQGFFYPSVTDNYSDVNRILYCTGKSNFPDPHFVGEVLNAERSMTALEERAIFEDIVKEVAGEQLDATTLAQVYEEIHQVIETNDDKEEPPKLDYRDLERVLTVSGVENVTMEKVERAFETIVDDKHYEMKASSVMPKFTTKSIKIDTKVATISVSPQDLKYVKQVNYHGRRCILIEVDEDAVIEGFTLTTENL